MQPPMGQAATMFNSLQDDLYGEWVDGGGEEMMEAQLLQARKELVDAVRTSADCSAAVSKLLHIKCPFTIKYSQLNVRDMLKDNSDSFPQLKAIPVALSMLEKYGRHLLKPPGARVDQWRQIKFNNPIFKDRVSPVHGALEVIQQLGYSESVDCGLQFAREEPDIEATCNIVADIILARCEIESYLANRHPNPELIHSFISKSAIEQLEAYWGKLASTGPSINPPPQSLAPNLYFQTPTPVSAPVEAEKESSTPVQTTERLVTVENSETSDPNTCTSQPLDDSMHKACDICGETAATLWCRQCDNKQLCGQCDDMWHRHPKRQNHERETVASLPSPSTVPADNIMGPFGIRAPQNLSGQSRRDLERSPPTAPPPPPPTPGYVVPDDPQTHTQAAAESTHARLLQHQQQLQFYQQLAQQQQHQHWPQQLQQQHFYGDLHTMPPEQLAHSAAGASLIHNPMGSLAPNTMRGQEVSANSAYHPSSVGNRVSDYQTYSGYSHFPTLEPEPSAQSLYMSSAIGQSQRKVHVPQPDYSLRMPQQGCAPAAAGYTDVTLRARNRNSGVGAPVAESGAFQSAGQRRASSFMSESALLKGILEESDYEKRAAKCDVRLLTLDEELQMVEAQFNDLLLTDPDCTESDEFKKLTRNKGRLMRETLALSSYKKELADLLAAEASHMHRSSSDLGQATQIFHPPSLSSTEPQYGQFSPQQVSAPYPAITSPSQVPNSAPYASPTIPQSGFSYPHQASHSPVHMPEPLPVSGGQSMGGRSIYGRPAQVSHQTPGRQEILAQTMHSGANSSIDQTSLLSQWKMPPSLSASSGAMAPVSQPQTFPAPRYQQGDYSNSASSYHASSQYPYSEFKGMPSPMTQEHSMADALTPTAHHLGESHSTGEIAPNAHLGFSRLHSAPVLPGSENAVPGPYVGFENFMAGEDAPNLQFKSEETLVEQRNTGSPAPGVSQVPAQRPTSTLNLSPPPLKRAPPVGQSAARFSLHEQRWECAHCTFINAAGTRVCTVCDRTSDSPTLVGHTEVVHGEALKSFCVHEAPTEPRKAPVGEAASEGGLSNIQKKNLVKIQRQIADEQDEVYLEKKEAHEQFSRQQKMLQQQQELHQQQLQQHQQQQSSQGSMSMLINLPPTGPPPPLPLDVVPPPPRPVVPPRKSKALPPIHQSDSPVSVARPATLESTVVQNEAAGGKRMVVGMDTKHSAIRSSGAVRGQELSSLGSQEESLSFIKEGDFGTTMERFSEQKRTKEQQISGARLLHFVKMADRQGFGLEEMQAALAKCQNDFAEALRFLTSDWDNLVHVVLDSARVKGQQSEQNDVGEVTMEEARKALLDNKGDTIAAVQSCVTRRKNLYKMINPAGVFAREEVLLAMQQGEGDKMAALEILHASVLQPYLHRVWQTCAQALGEASNGSAGILQQIKAPESSYQSISTSVINHPHFQQTVLDTAVDRDRRIRMILVEGKLKSWGRAELVIKLLDQDLPHFYPKANLLAKTETPYTLEDVIEAVRNCNDRSSARVYLTQECSTCFSLYPMSKIRSLNFCQCKICSDCLKQNFEVVIREKHVRHWTCPICSLPDLLNAETAEEYLNFLGMLLKHQVDREVFELFDTKVRDWRLQKEPNFRWCAHCASGFLADEHQLRMVCPHCSHKTCFRCKRVWEEQHEGLTCDQFAQWKIDNDPNNQAIGLARHLEENGIDCPSCKMRYALAKGGCMHFKCPQCGHEFCSGCNEPFYQKGTCPNGMHSCKTAGLHAHHPRDCFFYLRDEEVDRLQSLLRDHHVAFNTTPPQNQEDAEHCPVIEQKEFDSGKSDEPCGKYTQEGHAGLCITHYKEYLVGLINKKNIDPVTFMTVEELKKLLARAEMPPPKISKNETEANYRKRMIKLVMEKIPLTRRGP